MEGGRVTLGGSRATRRDRTHMESIPGVFECIQVSLQAPMCMDEGEGLTVTIRR